MSLTLNSSNVKPHTGLCEEFGAFVKKSRSNDNEFDKTESTPDDKSDFVSKNHLLNPENFENYNHQSLRHVVEDTPFQPGADGNIDWTQLADLTGTRPNVSKYSIERYSTGEWRKHNEQILDRTVLNNANFVYYNGKTAISTAHGNTDFEQINNTNRIKSKARDIYRWKVEFENACKGITEEIRQLQDCKQRLKKVCESLVTSELVTNECLQLRTDRRSKELIYDLTEVELEKEQKLEKDVKNSYNESLQRIEEQLKTNKSAKQAIEYGWTDKATAYNAETGNLRLNTKSNTILFKPGSVKLEERNTTPELYKYTCVKTLQDVEAARQRSVELRGDINATLQDGAHKLRAQADATDVAFIKTISTTKEALWQSEQNLKDTLQKLADMETLIDHLHSTIIKMDAAMKLAQTRLDIRNNNRPHVENVRDSAQHGLIQEVKTIHDTVTSLRGHLATAHTTRRDLLGQRVMLERDIADKLKTINIDKQRCQSVRAHFPAVNEMTGYKL